MGNIIWSDPCLPFSISGIPQNSAVSFPVLLEVLIGRQSGLAFVLDSSMVGLSCLKRLMLDMDGTTWMPPAGKSLSRGSFFAAFGPADWAGMAMTNQLLSTQLLSG